MVEAQATMANAPEKADSGARPPVMDTAAFEALTGFFPKLIQRRREKWDRLLADAFNEIERRIGQRDARALFASEPFLSFVIEATLVACCNHDDEKIGAVRNAVVRSALPGAPDEPLRLMFLGLLGHLTPIHLGVMRVLDDPLTWMQTRGMGHPRWPTGTSARVVEYGIPALAGREDLIELVVRDLQGAGLVQQGLFLRMPFTDDGFMQPRTTDTGRALVEFISPP